MSIISITACTGCNQGQGRCYISRLGDQCCNFYLENECMSECPCPLVSDSNYDCGKYNNNYCLQPAQFYVSLSFPLNYIIGCGLLPNLDNGAVSYTNGAVVGSVATHACNSGYQLSPQGNETRTCTRNGWDSQNFSCK